MEISHSFTHSFVQLFYSYSWLQPDRSVDMTASDLEFTSTDTPLRVSSQLKYVVRTRDQDKKLVYVEGMNVSIFLWMFVYSSILICCSGGGESGVGGS